MEFAGRQERLKYSCSRVYADRIGEIFMKKSFRPFMNAMIVLILLVGWVHSVNAQTEQKWKPKDRNRPAPAPESSTGTKPPQDARPGCHCALRRQEIFPNGRKKTAAPQMESCRRIFESFPKQRHVTKQPFEMAVHVELASPRRPSANQIAATTA
jgi:hypothetical protein